MQGTYYCTKFSIHLWAPIHRAWKICGPGPEMIQLHLITPISVDSAVRLELHEFGKAHFFLHSTRWAWYLGTHLVPQRESTLRSPSLLAETRSKLDPLIRTPGQIIIPLVVVPSPLLRLLIPPADPSSHY